MATTKTRAVTFISRVSNDRMVMHPADEQYINGRWVQTPGKTLEFQHGRYTTSDQDEIDHIRRRLSEPNGPQDVWELEAGAEAPDPAPVLAELAVASREEAEQILADELAGYERPVVIDTAEKVIAKRKGGRPPKQVDESGDEGEESGGPLG